MASRSARRGSTSGAQNLRDLADFQARYTTRGVKKPPNRSRTRSRSQAQARSRSTGSQSSRSQSSRSQSSRSQSARSQSPRSRTGAGAKKLKAQRKLSHKQQMAVDKARMLNRTPVGGGPGGGKRSDRPRSRLFSDRGGAVRSPTPSIKSATKQMLKRASTSVYNKIPGDVEVPSRYSDSSDDVAIDPNDPLFPNLVEKEDGFFPVIDQDGFCSPHEHFNPVNQNYSSLLKPYSVQIDTEIPVKRLNDQKLSLDYIPTHCFPRPGAYMVAGPAGSREPMKMYALPPGYWAQVQQGKGTSDAKDHCRDKKLNLDVYRRGTTNRESVGAWKVFKLEPGWFFYRLGIYALPRGYYLCGEAPVYLPEMDKFACTLRNRDTKKKRIPDPLKKSISDGNKIHLSSEPRADDVQKFLNHAIYFQILCFHAQKLEMSEYTYMKLFVSVMKPEMNKFDTFWYVLQQIEIFAYRVQRVGARKYAGPAPPLYTLHRMGLDNPNPKEKRHLSVSRGKKLNLVLNRNSMRIQRTRPGMSPLFRDQKKKKSRQAVFKRPPYIKQNVSRAKGLGMSKTYLDREQEGQVSVPAGTEPSRRETERGSGSRSSRGSSRAISYANLSRFSSGSSIASGVSSIGSDDDVFMSQSSRQNLLPGTSSAQPSSARGRQSRGTPRGPIGSAPAY